MTATAVCCDHCGQFYVVPESFSEKLEQDRLTAWLKNHEGCESSCIGKDREQ